MSNRREGQTPPPQNNSQRRNPADSQPSQNTPLSDSDRTLRSDEGSQESSDPVVDDIQERTTDQPADEGEEARRKQPLLSSARAEAHSANRAASGADHSAQGGEGPQSGESSDSVQDESQSGDDTRAHHAAERSEDE